MQELVVGIEKTKDEKLNKMIICGLLYLSTNKVGYFPALKSLLQTQTKKTSRFLHKTLHCHQCCLSQLSSRPTALVKMSDFLQTKVITIIKPRAHETSSYSAVLRPPLPDNLLVCFSFPLNNLLAASEITYFITKVFVYDGAVMLLI